jgi:hypothetical protein
MNWKPKRRVEQTLDECNIFYKFFGNNNASENKWRKKFMSK